LDLGVAEAADWPAVIRGAQGLGRVEDQRQTMARREFFEGVVATAAAEDVYREDGRRLRSDGLLRPLGVHHQGARIDVDEARRDALPAKGLSCRGECEGREQDLSFQVESPRKTHNCGGSIAEERAELHIELGCDPLFQPPR